MNREDARKLLGGYATGTLTPEERRMLFEAALEDQELFDELAREDAVREALELPGARERVLAAAGPPAKAPRRMWGWPAVVACAGAVVGIVMGIVLWRGALPAPAPAEVAQVRAPAAAGTSQAVPEQPETAPEPQPQVRTGALKQRRAPRIPPRAEVAQSPVAQRPPAAEPELQAKSVAPPPPPPPPATAATTTSAEPLVRPMAKDETANSAAGAQSAGNLGGQANPEARTMFFARANVLPRADDQASTADAATADSRQAPATGVLNQRRPSVVRRAAALAPTVPYLGVRYSVLVEGREGEWKEMRPGATLETGARVRLRFEPNDAGYLYVLHRDATGTWRLLAGTPVEKRTPVLVPAGNPLVYVEPGTKQLFAVLSRTPQQALAQLNTDELERRFGAQARGQLTQAAAETSAAGTPAGALYVVNAQAAPGAQQVAFEITLHYR